MLTITKMTHLANDLHNTKALRKIQTSLTLRQMKHQTRPNAEYHLQTMDSRNYS